MMNLMAHVGKRPSILQLVNRLSDLFFKLCRQESHQKGLSKNLGAGSALSIW
jgi:cob(I)alamin adenosyltransferase